MSANRPVLWVCVFVIATMAGISAYGAGDRADKPRLIVLTDIGGDPDDQQSMVRLMVYANEFDIEGLIASASGTPGMILALCLFHGFRRSAIHFLAAVVLCIPCAADVLAQRRFQIESTTSRRLVTGFLAGLAIAIAELKREHRTSILTVAFSAKPAPFSEPACAVARCHD
jgi:uncharacterized membrane protein